MKRQRNTFVLILLVLSTPALAWWGGGHDILTQATIKTLPDALPEFFRSATAGKMIAHCAYDPDLSKERYAPHARAAEYGEHYFDLELIKDNPVPENRDEFLKLCAKMELEPRNVGLLPYAVAEYTDRLAVAFAEYRKWPDNPIIQYKCYVYAGFLAHYAQDMCQPLHLTVHFDGIVQEDGSKLHGGIHAKVDSSIEILELDPTELSKGHEIKAVKELMPAIVEQIRIGNKLADTVYQLAQDYEDLQNPSEELLGFTKDLSREGVQWTATLFLTAWELSEKINLPGWLKR